jgi:hypothetical protein
MKTLAVNLLLLCTAVLAQQGSRKETPSEQRVGLIELEATTRIVESPIREGGYDDSFRIRRARYYVPDLLDCSDRITSAGPFSEISGAHPASSISAGRRYRGACRRLRSPDRPLAFEDRCRTFARHRYAVVSPRSHLPHIADETARIA